MSRPLCPHCHLPPARCHCRWITPVANRVEVIVWQHPREQQHPKGTLPLLQASLQQCQRIVAETLSPAQLPGATTPYLLFPATADTTSESGCGNHPEPAALLVIDATWRKARKILHLNPWLLQLPRLSLPAQLPARYRIRRAERDGQLSTLEAVCHGLRQLDDQPRQCQALLQSFDGYQQQLLALTGRSASSP